MLSSICAYSNPFESEPNYTQPFTYTMPVVIPSQEPTPAPKKAAVESIDSLINSQWPEFLSGYDDDKRANLMAETVIRARRSSPTLFEMVLEWARTPTREAYVALVKTATQFLSQEQMKLLAGLSVHFMDKEESLASYDFVVFTVFKWLVPNARS